MIWILSLNCVNVNAITDTWCLIIDSNHQKTTDNVYKSLRLLLYNISVLLRHIQLYIHLWMIYGILPFVIDNVLLIIGLKVNWQA